ncbi:MAG: hydroxymethylbilane synthase [Alphaproteobacteria bacterium]|nr:hydroxymethylbilane synthase [Alphaproteobacteria bacterium]
MIQTLRIGTRGSPLALAQARLVATALRDVHGWGPERIEIMPITTSGDMIRDRPLAEAGGKALWTKELDRALAEGLTDISVHSMKDVETLRPPILAIAAMLPRADVRDRLIGADSIAALAAGARVGTSSPRRTAQLLARRPDLAIVPFRGNVETRLRRIQLGEADATLLASAGLERLGHKQGVVLDDLLPAPSQGAIGVEIRADDRKTRILIQAIDHRPTHICVNAERRLLERLGGSCHSPIAALAQMDRGRIRLQGEILSPDGSEIQSGEMVYTMAKEEDRPAELAAELLGRASPALRTLFAG